MSLLIAVLTETSRRLFDDGRDVRDSVEGRARTFLFSKAESSKHKTGQGIKDTVSIPFLFPPDSISSSDSVGSAERCGRGLVIDVLALVWPLDIAVFGRDPNADFGLYPGPTLLEKLLVDVWREITDGVRDDDTELASDGLRG